jgi:hypothetical protein
MTRRFAASLALLLASAEPALATDSWLAGFAGFAGLKDSTYGYAGSVIPLNNNIDVDGMLFRISAGAGQYSYETIPGVRQGVTFQQTDAMMGYHTVLGPLHLSTFGGLELQNHDNPDPTAQVRGTHVGGKGQVEVFSPIGDRFYGFAFGSLSSNFNSFYTAAKIGYRVTDRLSFGPEGTRDGNDRYDHVSTGGFIGYDFGWVDVAMAGGYQWDLRAMAPGVQNADGPYGAISLSFRF